MKLTGKRVLITRPRAQAEEFADALIAEGAQPIFFPVIQIIPPDDFSALDFAIRNLDQYDWLMLTSVHGVEALFKRLETLGINRIPSRMQVAAVGSRTARCLSERGVWVEHVPDEYIPEAMLPGLGKNIYGKRFLFPQSNLARTVLADEIRFAGGLVTEVVAYRNVVSDPDISEINDLLAGVDMITFTSPSTVSNFIAIVRKNGLDPLDLPGKPLLACIGPITKKAAEEVGFSDSAVASEYTTTGLVEVLGKLTYT
jgi:uroporphyrinogen III methyltransferase / synthase